MNVKVPWLSHRELRLSLGNGEASTVGGYRIRQLIVALALSAISAGTGFALALGGATLAESIGAAIALLVALTAVATLAVGRRGRRREFESPASAAPPPSYGSGSGSVDRPSKFHGDPRPSAAPPPPRAAPSRPASPGRSPSPSEPPASPSPSWGRPRLDPLSPDDDAEPAVRPERADADFNGWLDEAFGYAAPAPAADPEPIEEESAANGTAWPHLDAPPAVVAGRSFEVQVGLGDKEDPAVYGTGLLSVPQGNFRLGVELIVDGFIIDGARTFTLNVTEANRYPKRTLRLIASANPQFAAGRRIGAVFRIGREMRGYAARDITVTMTEAELQTVPPAAAVTTSFGGFDISPFRAAEAADLTIIIQQGDAAQGSRFAWSAASPHADIRLPPDGTGPPLESSAERFLSELVSEATSTTDPFDLVVSLMGRGRAQIAPLMPAFVRNALLDVALAVAPRRPTVLLLTQDPYVPWELAVLDPPLPGWPADASPFLGAQAVVGRWVLAAEPPPTMDPPRHVRVADEVIVAGEYEGVLDWDELKSAEDEAKTLRQRWPAAHPVEATLPAVFACITGSPEADIIHFALHGRFATDDASQGLVLIGTNEHGKYPVYLKPSHVDAGKLSRAPLVFLNACQVGAGRAVLGNYSGMASAFVRVGAAAVIAPLWSVNDDTASEIAIDFYERVLDSGQAPAEVLRAYRAGVTLAGIAGQDHAASGTHIAYQFFGHPNLRLHKAQAAPERQS
jgi:CHAT domain